VTTVVGFEVAAEVVAAIVEVVGTSVEGELVPAVVGLLVASAEVDPPVVVPPIVVSPGVVEDVVVTTCPAVVVADEVWPTVVAPVVASVVACVVACVVATVDPNVVIGAVVAPVVVAVDGAETTEVCCAFVADVGDPELVEIGSLVVDPWFPDEVSWTVVSDVVPAILDSPMLEVVTELVPLELVDAVVVGFAALVDGRVDSKPEETLEVDATVPVVSGLDVLWPAFVDACVEPIVVAAVDANVVTWVVASVVPPEVGPEEEVIPVVWETVVVPSIVASVPATDVSGEDPEVVPATPEVVPNVDPVVAALVGGCVSVECTCVEVCKAGVEAAGEVATLEVADVVVAALVGTTVVAPVVAPVVAAVDCNSVVGFAVDWTVVVATPEVPAWLVVVMWDGEELPEVVSDTVVGAFVVAWVVAGEVAIVVAAVVPNVDANVVVGGGTHGVLVQIRLESKLQPVVQHASVSTSALEQIWSPWSSHHAFASVKFAPIGLIHGTEEQTPKSEQQRAAIPWFLASKTPFRWEIDEHSTKLFGLPFWRHPSTV
jgi:hypothetical protein